jgi:hypothetical protein
VALLVSLGTARNHVCRAYPCGICGAGEEERTRSYRCPVCDVYGKGTACWSCGSDGVDWNRIPPSGEKP